MNSLVKTTKVRKNFSVFWMLFFQERMMSVISSFATTETRLIQDSENRKNNNKLLQRKKTQFFKPKSNGIVQTVSVNLSNSPYLAFLLELPCRSAWQAGKESRGEMSALLWRQCRRGSCETAATWRKPATNEFVRVFKVCVCLCFSVRFCDWPCWRWLPGCILPAINKNFSDSPISPMCHQKDSLTPSRSSIRPVSMLANSWVPFTLRKFQTSLPYISSNQINLIKIAQWNNVSSNHWKVSILLF